MPLKENVFGAGPHSAIRFWVRESYGPGPNPTKFLTMRRPKKPSTISTWTVGYYSPQSLWKTHMGVYPQTLSIKWYQCKDTCMRERERDGKYHSKWDCGLRSRSSAILRHCCSSQNWRFHLSLSKGVWFITVKNLLFVLFEFLFLVVSWFFFSLTFIEFHAFY